LRIEEPHWRNVYDRRAYGEADDLHSTERVDVFENYLLSSIPLTIRNKLIYHLMVESVWPKISVTLKISNPPSVDINCGTEVLTV